MGAGLRVNKLRIDAHPMAAALYAALENVAHAEFAPNLARVDRLAFVSERGVSRDDEGAGDAGKVVVSSP